MLVELKHTMFNVKKKKKREVISVCTIEIYTFTQIQKLNEANRMKPKDLCGIKTQTHFFTGIQCAVCVCVCVCIGT